MSGEEPPERRRYNSTRRSKQAASTRQDVIDAAIACFGESGFGGTTLQAVADRAGVAVETVYAAFKNKKRLVRDAFEAAVVGDAEPVPLADRPEYAAMGRGTVAERLTAGLRLTAAIHRRSAPVWLALAEAASADAEVAAWMGELEAGRHREVDRAMAMVFGRALPTHAGEMVFVLLGPEVFVRLTRDLGWHVDLYASELVGLVTHLAADGR